MYWARIGIVAGLISLASSVAQAAPAPEPSHSVELQILANGQLVLSGQLIDSVDELEARLRVMRENQAPLDLRLALPKAYTLETIAAIAKIVQSLGATLGFIGNLTEAPKPAPAPVDLDKTI